MTLSLAGRTKQPVTQPVPVRIGGFGGCDGLACYLQTEGIDLLIDMTHPYAANISRNAAEAAQKAKIPLISFQRPPWKQHEEDDWQIVQNIPEAVDVLGMRPQKVFLALGRQELLPFEKAPQHTYVIRSVDPVIPPLQIPHAVYITDRGPFDLESEHQLLHQHAIETVVSKNSGGEASYGKIMAARNLGIKVVMVARPNLPNIHPVETLEEVYALTHSYLPPLENRGV